MTEHTTLLLSQESIRGFERQNVKATPIGGYHEVKVTVDREGGGTLGYKLLAKLFFVCIGRFHPGKAKGIDRRTRLRSWMRSAPQAPGTHPARKWQSLVRTVLTLSVLAVAMPLSAQELRVPDDWPLKPPQLGEGDRFRLVFVTSESYLATGHNYIAHYNTVIQDILRRKGHPALRDGRQTQGYRAQLYRYFKVLGSARDVNAGRNTGIDLGAGADPGVPIYWLGGTRVARDYRDFFDGTWSSERYPRTESGNLTSPSSIGYYTGYRGRYDVELWDLFKYDSKDFTLGGTEADKRKGWLGLGGSTTRVWVSCGFLASDRHGPLHTSNWPCSASHNGEWLKRPLYGLSPVFFVDSRDDVGFAQQVYEISEGADSTAPAGIALSVSNATHNGGGVEMCVRDLQARKGTDYNVANPISGNGNCVALRVPAGSDEVTFYPVHAIQNTVDERDGVFEVYLQNVTGDLVCCTSGRQTARIIIRDDDPTVVRLTSADSGPIEEGGSTAAAREAEFTVTLGRKLSEASDRLDVPLRITGTATVDDITLRNPKLNVVLRRFRKVEGGAEGTLSFFGYSQTETVIVTAVDDDDVEGDEVLHVALGSAAEFAAEQSTHVGGGAVPHATDNRVTIRIDDNDGVPAEPPSRVLVKLDTGKVEWTEGQAGTATLRVSISRELARGERVGVPLAFSSTTGAKITGTDRVIKNIGLAGATGIRLEDAKTANPKLIFEGPRATVASVTLNHNAALNDDDLAAETVEVRLGDLAAASLGTDVAGAVAPSDDGDPATRDNLVTIVIADNTDPPGAELEDVTVYEGEDAVFTVTLDKKWPVDLKLVWAVVVDHGTATAGSDYVAAAQITNSEYGPSIEKWAGITIPAGETTGTFTVQTLEDNVTEGRERFYVTLRVYKWSMRQQAYRWLAVATAYGNIIDRSQKVIVSPTKLTVKEADDGGTQTKEHEASYTVKLAARPSDLYVLVQIQSNDPGTVKILAQGRPVEGGVLDFRGRDWSKAQTVTIRGVDDTVDNTGNKRVRQITHQLLRLSGGDWKPNPNAPPVPVEVTVEDDDSVPDGITLTASPDSVAEDGGVKKVTVTATVTGGPTFGEDKTVAVAVGKAGDSAVEGTDYETVADQSVTIKAGTASAAVTFDLTPTNDNVDEEDETISVTGSSGTLAVTGDEITITDDDPLPRVSITSIHSPNETDPGSTASNSISFALGLDRPSSRRVTFSYKIDDVEAIDGEDYKWATSTAYTSGGTIPPGATSSHTYYVPVVRDTMYERDERVRITVTKVTNAELGDDPVTRTATIKNDDPLPFVSVADTLVDEGSTAKFPVTLSNAHYQGVHVIWQSGYDGRHSNPATPDVDFEFVEKSDRRVSVIGPGKTSGTIDIETFQDDESEGSETFVVQRYSGWNINFLRGRSTAIGTIVDDDAVVVRIDDAVVVEGGKAAFKVWLTRAVEQEVTVNWQTENDADGSSPATAGSDYTAVTGTPPAPVKFAAGETSATIEVQTTDDVIAESAETFRVSLSKATNVDVSLRNGEAVGTITDDDDMPTALTLTADTSATAGNQDEVAEDAGATKVTVMATLTGTTRYGEEKAVAVTVGKAGDSAKEGIDYAGVQKFEVKLPAGQASGSGTFTLTPTDDSVVEADETLSVEGKLSGVTVTGDTITIKDDDTSKIGGLIQGPPQIALSVTPKSVAENAKGTDIAVTATLAGAIRFADPVAVTVAVGASGDTATEGTDYGAVADFVVTIPGEQASGSGTFTLTPTADEVSEGDESLSVIGTADAISVYGAKVTIEDDEALPTARLKLTPATIEEKGSGNTSTVTATLSAKSSEAVTLQVAASGAAAGSFALSTNRALTIAAGALTSTGTVTVTAVDDIMDTPDKVVVVTAKASGGNGVHDPPPAALIITDDDERKVQVSADKLRVAEAPDPKLKDEEQWNEETYTVKLATEPTGPVRIDVGSDGVTAVTVTPTTLTFSASSWSEAQTVTVRGVDDSVPNEGGVRTAEVTHEVSADSTDYEDETAPSLLVGVMDNDGTPSRMVLYVDTGERVRDMVGEDAGPTEVLVTALLPEGARFIDAKAVTVAVGKTGDSAEEGADYEAVSDLEIKIPAGVGSGQTTFTLTPKDDRIDEQVESISLVGTLSGVTVTGDAIRINDNDKRGVTVSPTSVTVAESGDGNALNGDETRAEYTVVLSSEPIGTVTVGLSAGQDAPVTLSSASLEFLAGDWSEAQTVTVTAVDDSIDNAGDERTATITHTVSGGDYGRVTAEPVEVTVEDDDEPALVVTPAAVKVAEGGSKKYEVKLATEPSETVTVAITGHADTDVSLDVTSLEFTTAKWNEAQTVTVTAAADDDGSDDAVTLAHAASGGDYATVSRDVVVTVEDDDEPALVVTPAAVKVAEGGSKKYEVKLATEPSETVTVAITGHADTDVSLDVTSLEFTTAKWNEAQTVTVTAAADDDGSDDAVTLAHAASGGDYATVSRDVVVTVEDDDDPALVVTPVAVKVAEGGSKKYEVKLGTEPSETVTVTITGHASTDVSLDKASLEFTAAKWNEAQTVTVTAAADDDASDDEVTLAHAASGGDYATVSRDVVVTVEDDDDPALVVTPVAVKVAEEGSKKYEVKLGTEPSETVTVTITGHASTDVSLDKASLEFTAAKWNEAQTVTVTAAADDDGSDDAVTLAHAASGGDYATVSRDVVVTVEDDDEPALVVTPAAVKVAEGGSKKYEVKLGTEPSETVTVTITGHADTDVSLDVTSLEFTTAKWNEAQTVTVTAAADDDAADDAVTLAHAASGGDYATVSRDVVVTVEDDDEPALVVTPAAVKVAEGGSKKYEVKLGTEPSETVTVAITGHADTDVSLDVTSLEFTTAKWNEAQTVTVTAAADDDGSDDAVTLAHAASGGDYATVSRDVVVTVEDDDDPALVVTPVAVKVAEGGSKKYEVKLGTEPSETVTVTITGHASTDVSLDKASLEFTAAKWNEAQTVTVTAAADDDASDDAVTLAHAASGGDYATVSRDVVVTVEDDDDPALVVTPVAVKVAEGGSKKYEVKLATEPSETVTVTITGHASTDVSLDKASLEFTAAKWNEAQTVTVTAAADDDASDDAVTLAHAASGGDYATVSRDVVVTVEDDDDPALVVTPVAVKVAEGGSKKYEVKLGTEPSETVTVTITGHADTDVSLDKASLEFTTAKWNEAQTVTVTAAADDDGSDDAVTLAHAASGGDYADVSRDVVVTVEDDDEPALVVTPAAVKVAEGGSKKYEVKLGTEPSETVTVTITGHASTDVSLDKASLEFTAAKWNEAQTVTVTAAADDDASDDEVTLAHAASGGDYATVSRDVVVTVEDDDDPALVVTPAAVKVAEGGSKKYEVKLGTEPSETVTVTITGHADTDVSLDVTSLEFTTAKWNEAQTVTVTAAADDDAADDAVTLAHAASGGDYATVSRDVVVTVEDDDEPALVVTPAAVKVAEGGSKKYEVKLGTEPSETVTVAITGHADTDVSLDVTSLEFTTAKWNEAQTVTVTAAADDDGSDDAVTLAHAASGGDYATVSRDVVVTVEDDDDPALVVTPVAVKVAEGGSKKYEVKLGTEPSETVTVTITGHASTDVSLDKASLEFTAAKWNEAQTVTVTAAADDDASDDEVTLAHAASGGDYATVSRDVVVTVEDDDDPALVVTPVAVKVAEGGSKKYEVKLGTEPSETVTVTITGHASTDVSLDKASLEFTAAKWNEAQTVTVTAAADDDASDDAVTLAHAASGGDYATVSRDVVVTVEDDDDPALVVTPVAVKVAEGGSKKYEVKLGTEPSETVTVTITGHASTDVSLDKASLEFTTAKWNEAQTVTVTAAADDDGSDDAVTLAHAASGGDYADVSRDVVVTVEDDDEPALVVTPAAVKVAEGGSKKYEVKLATEPSETVTVAITGHADTDVSLDVTSLEFTTAKWNEAQTVTVTAAADDDGSDDAVTLAHAASGGDYADVSRDVVVTVEDDDDPALVVTPVAVKVAEGGSKKYEVKLGTEPSETVTVAITGHADTDVSLDVTSLEFTTAKWNEAQTVTVTAAADDDASDDAVTLAHAASGGDYADVSRDVVVTVEDDDEPALVVTPAAVKVAEGGSKKYEVKLATEPSETVTVAITGHADTDVSLDVTSLEFTTAKWNEAQTVTVTAAADDDASDDAVTLAHAASGGDYADVSRDVVVTVEDDDEPALVVTPAAVKVAEGGSKKYEVKLATEPSETVTVAITGHADTDVSLDKASLEFTTAKWNEAQTVTVTAAADDDGSDDAVTLAHAASGGDYATVSRDVVVTVEDDDDPALVVTPVAVKVAEGGSKKYEVKLGTEPSETVTVTITGHASTDVSLDKASLEFTAAKWNEAQTVTVTAAADDDASDDAVTLAHAASGGDYATVSRDVVVTVEDDDDPALVVTPVAVKVAEGGSKKYEVKLGTEPSETVTVAITGHADTDVSLDVTSLEFTTAKWNEAQTVTVTAAADDDGSDDAVTLAHAASGGDYATVSRDVVVTVEDDDDPALVVTPVAVKVAEGGSKKYEVKLGTEPSETVTVTITGHADTDVSLDKASLEFTTAKWNEAQTVTVTAAADDDGSDDAVTLAHAASGGDYADVSRDVVVTVEDDDEPALVVTPAAVKVAEGGSKKYEVKLGTEPSETVTVTITGHASTDVSLDKASLEFTAAKWNEAQTVTVTAAADDDASDDEVTLAHAASGGDYATVSRDVVVTVEDDDDPALVVTPVAVKVAEGGSKKYEVKLGTEPSETVTVTITGHASTDVSLDKASLEFTTAKWNEAQTVTVTAAADDDGSDDAVTLAHAASGGDYADVSRDVVVTVEDDDEPALVVTPAAVKVAEGGSKKYEVKLATEPSETVTVAITGHADTDVSLDKASLEFTTAKWNEAQTVTVTAAADDDGSDDAVTLAHAASGGDYADVSADVVVTVEDDDDPAEPTGITLTTVPDRVIENGGVKTITVTAAVAGQARFTTAKTVAVSVNDGTAESPADYKAVADFEITITVGAASATGSFTLTPVDDAVDEENETLAVTGTADAVVVTGAVITIEDDDVAELNVSDGTASEGDKVSFTISLSPVSDRAVTVKWSTAVDTGTDAHGATAGVDYTAVQEQTVTFSAGETSQKVEVQTSDDSLAEEDETFLVKLTGPVSATLGDGTATGTITDDDGAPAGVTLTAVPDRVNEHGGPQTITVTATVSGGTQYPEPKTITVSVNDGTADSPADYAAVTDFDITIAAGATSATGSFTLTPVNDAEAEESETIDVTGVAGALTIAADTITITDNDAPLPALVVTPLSLTVGEGRSRTYTVKLATEPSAAVTVAISGHAATDVSLDKTSLEFTTAKWNEAQTVTVSAGQDDDRVDDRVTLAHKASGGDYGSVTADVEVTVEDDDESPTGITLTAAPDRVTENSGAQTIKVTATVDGKTSFTAAKTVTVSVNDGSADSPADYAAVADFDITIVAGATSATGSFTLTPVNDAEAEENETIDVTGVAGTLTITADTITITDNDAPLPALVVTPLSLTVGEGRSRTYTVKLATEPSAAVTVAISGHAATDVSLDKTSLEFTTAKWNEAQTVMVTAEQDADAANDAVTLAHTASGGDYTGVTKDVAVTVEDDDKLSTAINLSLSPAAVSEGAGATEVTVTASLNTATLPTDVVMELTVDADTAGAEDFAAVAPFTLTIAAGTISGTVPFTFSPVDDRLYESDETVTVHGRTIAPPDSTLVVTPAVLTVTDNEEAPEISIADAGVDESAGELVFPVTLSGASAFPITVSYRTVDGTAEAGIDYTAGVGELSFAPGKTERSVTIAVIDDELDEADETFLVQLDAVVNATMADGEATGTISDEDEAPAITITDARTVESSGEIVFRVQLDAPSGLPISVVSSSSNGTALDGEDYVSQLSVLTFEPGETETTIRMEVVDDAVDEDDEYFMLDLSEPTNGRLPSEVASAVGTIADDDAVVTVAWLARFGRTVTQQVLEAVGERTRGSSALGSQVTLAGHQLNVQELDFEGEDTAESDVMSGSSSGRIMNGGQFMAESSFLMAIEPEASEQAIDGTDVAETGVHWTMWGRGAAAHFEGVDGWLSMDGNVLTALAGVDAEIGGLLAGLAVGRSDGNGGYDVAEDARRPARDGDLEAELTSVYPYVRVAVTDALSVWGVFGYGIGELRQVERERLEEQTDIGMLLGAVGSRGQLLTVESSEGHGLEVALKADGYLLRMTSESTAVLPMVEANVSRLRLIAEGSGQLRIGPGLIVRPSVEVGVRHDSGDVENGTGMEFGGGLSLVDLGLGLALSGNARMLLSHEDQEYRDWGASGTLSYDPGAPGRGLMAQVDSSYGTAASGVEQLWAQGAETVAPGGAGTPGVRLAAELGYGVGMTTWSVHPYAGIELTEDDSPTWRTGARFGIGTHDVVVEGSVSTGATAISDYRLMLNYSVHW